MKILPCSWNLFGRQLGIGCLAVLLLVPIWLVNAQENRVKGNAAAARIFIRADKLIADNNTRLIEMIGNVRAVRGDMVIQADQLKVYPHETKPAHKLPSSFKRNVQKVEAVGNVRITYGEVVALADRAVYSALKDIIELTGKPTRVSRGAEMMTANRMTLFIEDERIRVSGQGKQRVKAVFNK
jgi:lipopolysaccharide export system protein LptA